MLINSSTSKAPAQFFFIKTLHRLDMRKVSFVYVIYPKKP